MARRKKKAAKKPAVKKTAAKKKAAGKKRSAPRKRVAPKKSAAPKKRAAPRRRAALLQAAAVGVFTPPAASQHQLAGVPFDRAVPFATEAKTRFDVFDRMPGNRDPSQCKALLKFPDSGADRGAIFWSAKMAIDTDGPAAAPGRRDGQQLDPSSGRTDTSLHFANGDGVPAEVVPYIVLPQLRPGSNQTFDPAVAIGDVAVVIFKDKITAAVCGDLGPFRKIGEASIRVHEVLEQAGCPDPCVQRDANGFCLRARNSSVGEDVLYFVFPGSAFEPSELALETINAKVEERALRLYDKLRGAS